MFIQGGTAPLKRLKDLPTFPSLKTMIVSIPLLPHLFKKKNPEDFSILKLSMGKPSVYLARRGCVSYNYCCVPLVESFKFFLCTSKNYLVTHFGQILIAFLAFIALSEWMFIWICSRFPQAKPVNKSNLKIWWSRYNYILTHCELLVLTYWNLISAHFPP